MAKTLILVALILALGLTLQVKQQHTDFAKIEVGKLSAMQDDGNQWHYVVLQNHFTDPVVLMQITSYNGGNPVHIRLQNIQNSSFEFKMEEWDYLDEWHTDEDINFLVAEKGTYTLACGNLLQVGTVGDVMENFVMVHFQEAFNNVPVVHTQCQTHNGGHAVVTRTDTISNVAFEVKLKEQETYGAHPNAEVVGYIAIQSGNCGVISADITDNNYDHTWRGIPFSQTFKEEPVTFVSIQSHHGGNTAGIRMRNLMTDSCEVFVEEEQSNDDEMTHLEEVLGWLAIEAPQVTKLELVKNCDSTTLLCQGYWDCSTIKMITQDVFDALNTNEDEGIAYGDDVDQDHLQMVLDYCDGMGAEGYYDGVVTICELHDCVMYEEEMWRLENCDPDFPSPDCQNPFLPCIECDGLWMCSDIDNLTDAFMSAYDSNGDGVINYGDSQGAATALNQPNGNLASIYGDAPMSFTLTSNCVDSCNLYWVDYEGNEVYYAQLNQGDSITQQTYETHPWRVYNLNNGDLLFEEQAGTHPLTDGADLTFECQSLTAQYIIEDSNLQSTGWDTEIFVTFHNTCSDAVDVYWVDYDGINTFYATLYADQAYTQHTYETHPWRVYNQVTGQLLYQEVAGQNDLVDGNTVEVTCDQPQLHDDHVQMLLDHCDYLADGVLMACEVHQCLVDYENWWRSENCELFPELVGCEIPCDDVCYGSWDCPTIEWITEEIFSYYDTNGDYNMNIQDDIEEEHLTDIMMYCDTLDGNLDDGNMTKCELHTCIVEVENVWRSENCPASFPQSYCPNPFDCPQCPDAWSCEQMMNYAMETMAAMDNNEDGVINNAEYVTDPHLSVILDECDMNGDESVCLYELFQCVLNAENDWRYTYCPQYGSADCENPFDTTGCECVGMWTCGDIHDITEEIFNTLDINGDEAINLGDIPSEHLQELNALCDANGNGQIEMCEMFDCLVAYENEWRDANCPDFGDIECPNPYPCEDECEGAWYCDDIVMIALEYFNTFNTDGSMSLNANDDIEDEHLSLLLAECDANNDGNVLQCEIENCLVVVENEWRAEHCPEYGMLYCEDNCDDVPPCDYEWNCDDILYITMDFFNYYDTNQDGQINAGDNVDASSFEIVGEYCDFNMNNSICRWEVFECLVDHENSWRELNCPEGYMQIFCNNPFNYEECYCEGAWECEDIYSQAEEIFSYYNTNDDDFINMGDEISQEHLAIMNEYCDENGDQQICQGELENCLLMAENEWRELHCHSEFGSLYCPISSCTPCEGAMSCEDIETALWEFMIYYDGNNDLYINPEDDVDPEFYDLMVEQCDVNFDGNVSLCEIHLCMQAAENDWRDEYCPEYGHVYCPTCPQPPPECIGAMNCLDVANETTTVMQNMDVNGDGWINLGDEIDPAYADSINFYCDLDGNDQLSQSEVFYCIVAVENEWRATQEGCPVLYCDIPIGPDPPVCYGAWHCDDIYQVTESCIAYYDTNNDGVITFEDDGHPYEWDEMAAWCDLNGDCYIDKCELHTCVMMFENEWRDYNCPDYGYVYCECPYIVASCPEALSCDQILEVALDYMSYYDYNMDGAINPIDLVDEEDYENMVLYCDQDNDGSIDFCELADCIVMQENEWLADPVNNCLDTPALCCETQWECDSHCGNFNCGGALEYANMAWYEYDTNADGAINIQDISAVEVVDLVDYCDDNGSGAIDQCEFFRCVVKAENHWRNDNCELEDLEHLFCPTPMECPECPDAWTCDDMEYIAIEVFDNMNTNSTDDVIALDDNVDQEHFEEMVYYCDINNDGVLDRCEIFLCIVDTENEWRQSQCPGFELAYCEVPFTSCPWCEYAWSCADVNQITLDVMAAVDTNNDGYYNEEDQYDEAHLDLMLAECDYNNDGTLSFCEVHDCLIEVENYWRAENCMEGYGDLVCLDCIPDVPPCDGAWNCDNIYNEAIFAMDQLDSNGDGQINQGDQIDNDHYYLLVEQCDGITDGVYDESVNICEIQECLEICENQWRADNCPQSEPIYCDAMFICEECPYHWSCSVMADIAANEMNYADTNGDGVVNDQDDITVDHYEDLGLFCDYNDDDVIDPCEMYQCVVDYENSWRATNCPEFGDAYCPDVPFVCPTCPGAWTCGDIATHTECIVAYFDTDGNGVVDPSDNIDPEQYELMMMCDQDHNGSLEACELFDCEVQTENEWRMAECPGYQLVECEECPYPPQVCDYEWNCLDIIYITDDFMSYYNTNGDLNVDLNDNIEVDHLNLVLDYCDADGNQSVDACEIHDCIIMCENTWRLDACEPGYAMLYCSDPALIYDCPECDPHMNCSDIAEMAEVCFNTLNTNSDNYINLNDNLDEGHWDDLLMYCDQDGDELIDICEVHDCIVMAENEYRAEYCPDYPDSFCTCPFIDIDCAYSWNCPDIEYLTYEFMNYYNTNGDSGINPEDNIDSDHLTYLVEVCDQNNDGTLMPCEIHDCLVWVENEWRMNGGCPVEYGYLICQCEIPEPQCYPEGSEWNCDDIEEQTNYAMAAFDTNGDLTLNYGDDVDSDVYEIIMSECDYNGDQQVHAYEMFECIRSCENAWRDVNCDSDYPSVYCENPFPHCSCEPDAAWTCDDINVIVNDWMVAGDVNGDGLVNLGDMSQDDLDNWLYCDYNENGELDECEIHACLVNHENEWRAEYCDDCFGEIYCAQPTTCMCFGEDAWGCPQIMEYTEYLMDYYDTSSDSMINPEDLIDEEHYEELVGMCDQNFDGSVSFCELHDCVLAAENAWRAECGMGDAYCTCSDDSYEYCEYEWNCLDIMNLTQSYWDYYNTNGDNTINYEDNYDQDHIELLQYYCDYDNDDTITICEIHMCYMDVENTWRHEYCPQSEDLYCDAAAAGFDCIYCADAWNCEEIWDAATQAMWYLDSNNDDNINATDDITDDELQMIIDNCDMNGDGNVTECEFFECSIMCENAWRDEFCPGYGYVYCTLEQYCTVEYCYGDREPWTCEDIVNVTLELFDLVDTDGNMNVNPEDDFSGYGDLYDQVIDLCDFSNDGNLSVCEVHECVIMIENAWRADWCTADYGMVDYCESPFECDTCEGEWNCADIELITADYWAQVDTDVNGQVNANDEIDPDHYDFLLAECDTDGNGGIDMCELHDCVIMVENEWRAANCPVDYPNVYCYCPFDVIDCPYEWTCDDIFYITEDFFSYYDSNNDEQLNYGDENLDDYHLDWLNEYCDQDQDQQLNKCEIFECVVACENAYRTEYCAGYSMAYCETPYVCVTCEGAWNCDEIDIVMAEVIAYYDTNGDNAINPEDYIDDEHYGYLLESCDTNYDGTISQCEIHACIVEVENQWRLENCPAEYGPIYCPGCQDHVCENAWNCLDIIAVNEYVMIWMDNNQDGTINQGDYIYKDDLEVLMVACDLDGNNSLDECEVHDCLVLVENNWRANYCPDAEDLYCANPYECAACYGAWTCDDVYDITMEYMYYTDVNGDGLINYGDDMSEEHMEVLQASCDFDNDGSLDQEEVHQCIIMAENEWRAENCPDYGDLICTPIQGEECPGMWTCDFIDELTLGVFAYYTSDDDMALNEEDQMDPDHLEYWQQYCDFNNDGSIDYCEMHECVVISENEWRMVHCPDYGAAYCPCDDGPECYGAWSCTDVILNTEDYLYNYDTNNDGQINLGDNIDDEHLTVLLQNCDTDMNGQIDACEIHQCMIDAENAWRAENCPELQDIYCDCTFLDAVCPAAWHCEDIEMISAEIIAYYDTNGDTAIDLQDDIDEGHYAEIDAYCNYDGNDFVDSCEVHQCIVMIENEWRDYNCPDYGYAYCDCPFYVQECYGALTCEEIDYYVVDIIEYYDTSMDGVINPEDYIEEEHYGIMVEYCDTNFDGTIDACEVHECLMIAENEYREINCVDYPEAVCSCDFYVQPCDGAWNCLDVISITEEVFAYYDTNGDDNINLGDQIEGDHLDVLIEYCDYDQNGSLNSCEIHDCVVVCENEWRHEYCPESEDLYCSCPYDVAYCPDAWTCYDISAVVAEVMSFYDVNFNAALDLEDSMEPDHYLLIMETCDANGDDVLDYCETYDCIVLIENEWRDENCPEYGHLYCACPYSEDMECNGAWDCEDIMNISIEILAYYDTNGDGSINLEDDIDADHLAEINTYCDYNGDGQVDSCEVHQCIVDIENSWRAEYCPDYPMVYCDCPFTYDAVECDGAWYCDDILEISVEIMEYYDTNGDGTISLEDDIDADHLAEINMYCDYSGDGVTDACEVHACIVMIENDWRDEYCPDYGHLYCDCPFVVAECDGAWDCEDIYNISIEVLNYYDTNYDGSINLEDDIESEHLDILIEYCDYNNDGTVDACEVHQCIVDCENAWRDEYCPDYGYIACDCPFYAVTCDGAWNCDDIYYISIDVINYYDTDYDGDIDLNDNIDPDHLAVLQEQCDYNGDGVIDSCEVHMCVVQIENDWRDEYCPDSEHVYCDCPF